MVREMFRRGRTKYISVPPMMAFTVSPWTVKAPFCCATASDWEKGDQSSYSGTNALP